LFPQLHSEKREEGLGKQRKRRELDRQGICRVSASKYPKWKASIQQVSRPTHHQTLSLITAAACGMKVPPCPPFADVASA
jgi:hypothetical protein